jgi:hypothetical protein
MGLFRALMVPRRLDCAIFWVVVIEAIVPALG